MDSEVGDVEAGASDYGTIRPVRMRLMAMLVTLAATLVVAASGALWTVATGTYNVSADEAHWPVTEWAATTLKHRSVAARAGSLPVSLPDDENALRYGFDHFHGMCIECHGAPGFDRGEAGRGLNPRAPRLEEEAHEWTDAELFWITKHGIRMTGMPAFGPTHGDEEIAGIVAFIRAMETMTEEDYAERVRAQQESDAGDVDSHAAGPPDHEH